MHRVVHPLLFIFTMLIFCRGAVSQELAAYQGQQVMVITDGAEFKDKQKVVARASLGDVYLAEKVNGPWLFVRDRAGWIRGQDVVLYEKADEHFTRLIQKEGSARNYYSRGTVRLVQRQWDRSIEDFTQVIRLQPKLAAAYGARAEARHNKGEVDRAIEDYNEVIRLQPKDPVAYHNRSFAWQDKKDFDKAIADCDAAIRFDPKFAAAYNNRGLARYSKGEFQKAISDYDQAIKLDPTNPVAYSNRGSARTKLADYQSAIDDFTAAIRLQPNDVFSHIMRGDAFKQEGQYAQAIEDYRRAIQLNPRIAHPHASLAWLLATCPDERYRDGEQAIEEGKAACELSDWKDGRAIDSLAAAYAQAGNYDEAIKWQHKAIEISTAPVRKEYETRLEQYQHNEPYREAAAN